MSLIAATPSTSYPCRTVAPAETRLTFKANDQDLILLQTVYWPGNPHLEGIESNYNQFTRF